MRAFKHLRNLTVVAALVALVFGSVLLGRSAWSALMPPTVSTATFDV